MELLRATNGELKPILVGTGQIDYLWADSVGEPENTERFPERGSKAFPRPVSMLVVIGKPVIAWFHPTIYNDRALDFTEHN